MLARVFPGIMGCGVCAGSSCVSKGGAGTFMMCPGRPWEPLQKSCGTLASMLGLGIPMIVTADSGDRDRAVPGPWI